MVPGTGRRLEPRAPHRRGLGLTLPAGLAALAILAGCLSGAAEPSLEAPPEWQALAPGLEMALARAGPSEATGSAALVLVRIDPALWRVEPRHYADEGLEAPPSLEDWVRRTGAPVVFNAGFYFPDRRHIGLLLRDGHNIGTKTHPKWKGLLVSDPSQAGASPVAILDLLEAAFPLEDPSYRSAVQSLMILKDGRKRLGKTEKTASRTAVAIDARGRLLVVWAEGAHSLWNLADVLDRSGLEVRRAMTMDGGREAQLAVEAGGTSIRKYGSRSGGAGRGALEGQIALPAVVTVVPRD